MTPKRAISYSSSTWPSYFQAIDCGSVDHKKKQELTNNSGTYPKSVDPKVTLKGTVTYPMKSMGQNLPNVILIKGNTSNKKSSTDDLKNLTLILNHLLFWQWPAPNMSESQPLLYNDSSIVKRSINASWKIKERTTKNTRTYIKSTDPIVI